MVKKLEEINETAKMMKEIVDSLEAPSTVRNIENIRLTVESVQNAASKAENSVFKKGYRHHLGSKADVGHYHRSHWYFWRINSISRNRSGAEIWFSQ